LAALDEVGARCWGGPLTFHAEAGTTYHFQVRGVYNEGSPLRFHLETTPPPQAEFWFNPGDPSVFETVYFNDYSWDPGEVGIASQAWDLGDGTSDTGCCPSHRYAADGDYTVQLAVTTYDGRTGSTSKTVSVRTHDVAIFKFSAPQAAKAKQTRTIVVGISSKRYPEQVQVELYKSVPSGFDHVGGLRQYVPIRSGGRTTDFKFSYTFSPEDASIGKVTFKAVAYIIDARDALPADNEAISAPAKVSR
jgi:PKD repeat protein